MFLESVTEDFNSFIEKLEVVQPVMDRVKLKQEQLSHLFAGKNYI